MTAPSIREAVARALWALNENTDCPDYDLLSKPAKERALSWADAALAVALPILRTHYAKMVDDAYYSGTMPYALVSSAIRADEGPK